MSRIPITPSMFTDNVAIAINHGSTCLFNSHYYVNKIENMRTNDSKTSVDSKLEEMEEKYPVEQIAVKNEKKITAKDVKEAVKEINPDTDSLGSRG